MEEVFVRKFNSLDRQAVRDIAWETAFIGESADAFFSGKEILADFLAGYFTDYEPDSCFVAVAGSQVAGYLIGSRDYRKMEEVFKKRIFWKLLVKFIFSGAVFRRKNLRLALSFALSFLKGEFNMSEIKADYPAVMHINLRKDFRGKGVGARLIRAFEEYLNSFGVKGMHLATMSETAGGFFRKQGFSLLSQYRRSYFRYILGKDIKVYIYGKKL
jgi:GNAT superfamily N-acetyltransferase